jgi:DNA-binding MarR family transcriptional regulator
MENYALSSSLRSVISALHKGLRKQMSSVHSYSMTEIETIGHLMRNPFLLPTELATLTRVTTQSMSAILKKLEEQDIIVRKAAKDDGRKWYISLTAAGKKMVDKVRYEKDEWLKEKIEKTLSDKEKDLLEKAIQILNKLVKTEERN